MEERWRRGQGGNTGLSDHRHTTTMLLHYIHPTLSDSIHTNEGNCHDKIPYYREFSKIKIRFSSRLKAVNFLRKFREIW